MLIDHFALNLRDEEARNYLYIEILCYYTFKKEKVNGQNISRQVKCGNHYNCVGRMYSVSPNQIELFYLQLLLFVLCNVKKATSFEYLRTVNGQCNQIFSATCLAN